LRKVGKGNEKRKGVGMEREEGDEEKLYGKS